MAKIDDVAGFDMMVGGTRSGDWFVAVERKIARWFCATSDQIGRSGPFAAVGTEFKIRWETD